MSEERLRLDDLIIGNFSLWQDPEEFCFSMDAVWLGQYVNVQPHKRYAELGTASGAISHILIARGATSVVGFELNEKTAALCEKNCRWNHIEDKLQVVQGDYREAYKNYGGQFDHVVVNPPYFPLGKGAVSDSDGRKMALHEAETTLIEVAKAAKRLLKFGGYFWMVYRADQLLYALETLRSEQLEPKRIRFIHSHRGDPSKWMLISAKLGSKEGVIIEEPLFVYKDDGSYDEEVMQWYRKEEQCK